MAETISVCNMVPFSVAMAHGGSIRPLVLVSLILTIRNETGKHEDELGEALLELLEDVAAKGYADDPRWRDVVVATSDDAEEFNTQTNDMALDLFLWSDSMNKLLDHLVSDVGMCDRFVLAVHGEATPAQFHSLSGVDGELFNVDFHDTKAKGNE